MEQIKNGIYKDVGRHVLFWAAYIIYYIFNEGWEHGGIWHFSFPWQIFTDLPVAIITCYINLYFFMPAWYFTRKYVRYIIGILCLLLFAGMSGRFFSWLIFLPIERAHDPASDEPVNFWIFGRIVKNSFEAFPILGATMFLKLSRNSFKHEQTLREIEKEKHTAEMGLLKAQINPHFLFNTLNSLYSLTLDSSKKAPQVVLRLADLMRYMLYEAKENKVLLDDEIKYLENYIGIEQMRFAERLELSFQYSGEIEGKMISPLLLLPFVENAFKHGIENNSGWITIDLKVVGANLFFKVENSYQEISAPAKSGFGLDNVKKRLELIYPGVYKLNFDRINSVYKVDLKITL